VTMAEDRPGIQIRFARPDDAPSIAAVLRQSFMEYISSYTEEAFAATTPTSDQVVHRMNEGPVWVAVINNAIVGSVSAVPRGEALYIRSMAVLPAARGKEVGEALLRCVESFALAHGNRRLFLTTTPFLTRAIRLYERMRYRHSGEGPHDLFGTPLFTMEKDVVASG
jgi:ribosomal protein S18 acetylase RimI-like enzyme